tara:strand:- start:280 stop:798 length:519 start_codon:yes stop_codon:yes gene_type:complete
MFNISIECLFIIICLVATVTFALKKGIHSICLIVLLSYILFFIVDSLTLTGLQYYAFDILRIALISIILLIVSGLSQDAKYYLYYSTVLLLHIVIQFAFMFGMLGNSIFDYFQAITNALELTVFFNGIYRSITAVNGRGSESLLISDFTGSLYRFRHWFDSHISSLQKGGAK